MKRILPLLFTLLFISIPVFAAQNDTYDDGDEYDDGYIYQMNGPGDQFVKADFDASIPLNFNNKLYVGGGFSMGYYRFVSNTIALGGEVSPTYNVSIGAKSLIQIPLTLGVLFQPEIGKFEFPIGVGLGITSSTFSNTISYFPAFTAKGYVGGFYRINESWSAGINCNFLWIAQWVQNSSQNYNGMFLNAGLSIRYHF